MARYFKRGLGVFICENCGKRTRGSHDSNARLCKGCLDTAEHENMHADHDYLNDECGEPDCPVKNYTSDQRWWRK